MEKSIYYEVYNSFSLINFSLKYFCNLPKFIKNKLMIAFHIFALQVHRHPPRFDTEAAAKLA